MILDGFPALAALVERRLEQAVASGELSNLPGAGRPLELDEDPLVPVEVRIAHRALKNAGLLPPDLADLVELRRLIASAREQDTEGGARPPGKGAGRLRALIMQLEAAGRHAIAARAWQDYEAAICERLARADLSSSRGTMPAENKITKPLAEDL
jgi:hypothetical protein